jgi:hypothetical protein
VLDRILYRTSVVLLESGASRHSSAFTDAMRAYYWFSIWTACLVSCLAAGVVEARSHSTYKVHGTVLAITLTQTPPLIVVKTPLGPKNHMTVGATVTAQTKIMRGNKRVALSSIREGEVVWLTYTKAPGGVLAEVIRVGA